MDTKESGNERPVESPESKKVYDSPVLTVFGNMQTITQINLNVGGWDEWGEPFTIS
jgi:hypothetical protein